MGITDFVVENITLTVYNKFINQKKGTYTTMTFEELFRNAVANVDLSKKYSGRKEAIEAVVTNIDATLKVLQPDLKWTSTYAINPYGKDDPYINVYAHNIRKQVDFKVKLKKTGSHTGWYGSTTYYAPVLAFTCDEELMTENVVEYLNKLYDTTPEIDVKIKDEQYTEQVKEQYKDLITRYKEVVNELQALPDDIRKRLNDSLPTYYTW